MFDITLICMGKLKEKFYLSAAEEYEKRLKGYCSFHLIELPEVRDFMAEFVPSFALTLDELNAPEAQA